MYMTIPTINEMIKLLENSIDCNTMDKNHSGYTAKEIHRKCLRLLQAIEEDIQGNNKSHYKHNGWGITKGE